MTEYPRLTQLLQQLCQLNDEDMALPFDILINMYRAHLRRPLEAMAALAPAAAIKQGRYGAAAKAARQAMDETWPILAEGAIFYEHHEIALQESGPRYMAGSELGLQRQQAATKSQPVVAELINELRGDWGIQEPLVALHRLSWGPEFVPVMASWLEAQLNVHEDVAEMVLTMGSR